MEVSDPEPDDLGDPHPGQTGAKNQIVSPAHIGVIADSEQGAVRLLVGQPAGRVLALELPLQRRRVPERVLPALQFLDQPGIGQLVANTPTKEDADPGETIPAGVVVPGGSSVI